ncbi:hypothetical protein [Labrenzia sp. PHM005]|uniref:hypothetical protein n=1 Tax=Labrenzia sp. PHM005 TaxID=2590016 RepID=UPI001140784E|nr:hypothetical protein [Labrenzia sp. PHM005]QDG77120.1 hypothetical protein FJ695_15240 [Labrenzia sp. PHM005]
MKSHNLLIPAVIASAFAIATPAEARPDLRKMTCAQAQQLVLQHGAVVFTTGRHTYSMYVSNRSWCDWGQQLFPQYGPTRDNPKCHVAFECREPLFRPFSFDD